jgi:hypothetical protein
LEYHINKIVHDLVVHHIAKYLKKCEKDITRKFIQMTLTHTKMFEGHDEEGISLNYNQMNMDDHDLNKHMQVERNNGRIFKHLWKIGEKEQKLDCTINFYDHYCTIYAIHI